jgi:hypothetical protein
VGVVRPTAKCSVEGRRNAVDIWGLHQDGSNESRRAPPCTGARLKGAVCTKSLLVWFPTNIIHHREEAFGPQRLRGRNEARGGGHNGHPSQPTQLTTGSALLSRHVCPGYSKPSFVRQGESLEGFDREISDLALRWEPPGLPSLHHPLSVPDRWRCAWASSVMVFAVFRGREQGGS